MHPVMIIFELALLVIGALFLVRSLTPIKRLILELPDGNLKKLSIVTGKQIGRAHV